MNAIYFAYFGTSSLLQSFLFVSPLLYLNQRQTSQSISFARASALRTKGAVRSAVLLYYIYNAPELQARQQPTAFLEREVARALTRRRSFGSLLKSVRLRRVADEDADGVLPVVARRPEEVLPERPGVVPQLAVESIIESDSSHFSLKRCKQAWGQL